MSTNNRFETNNRIKKLILERIECTHVFVILVMKITKNFFQSNNWFLPDLKITIHGYQGKLP